MDYASHYERLISRARGRVLEGYRERHHVVPKCMGGDNSKSNIVELTGEEHYVAHQLLCKIHKNVSGLITAAIRMARQCTGNKAYGWIRRLHAAAASKAMKGNSYGVVKTEEHRAKLVLSHIGKKASPEARSKLSASLKGHAVSKDTREKIGRANRGKYVGIKRAPRSPEHQEKLAASRRGTKATAETRAKLSAAHTGKKRSAEHRESIARARRGWKMSPESVAKTAAARRGMKHTDEAKAKMSAKLKGRKTKPCTPELRAKLSAIHKAIWESGKGKNKYFNPESNPWIPAPQP